MAHETELFHPGPDQMGFAGFVCPSPPEPSRIPINLEFSLDTQDKETELPTEMRSVRIADINILVQARDEYNGIGTLAEAIKSARVLLHTPFVAEFDEEGARRYLDFVYGIYGDKVEERKRFGDLTPHVNGSGDPMFLIAVSGHRRIKALQYLNKEEAIVKVAKDIDPLHALYLQAQENTPKPLKDYERAEQHGRLFAVAGARNPDLSLGEYAKSVGQKPDVIRRDLRYYHLPAAVKNYVVPRQRYVNENGETVIPDQALMSFNVAAQLGRLVEASVPEFDILFVARRFFEENVTSEREASKRINAYLREYKLGDTSMIDLFGYKAQRLEKLRRTKRVAQRFERPIDDATAYFNRVIQSRERDMGGNDEDSVSLVGAASRIRNLAEVAQKLIPMMHEAMDPEEAVRISSIFAELEKESGMLEEIVQPQNDSVMDMGVV